MALPIWTSRPFGQPRVPVTWDDATHKLTKFVDERQPVQIGWASEQRLCSGRTGVTMNDGSACNPNGKNAVLAARINGVTVKLAYDAGPSSAAAAFSATSTNYQVGGAPTPRKVWVVQVPGETEPRVYTAPLVGGDDGTVWFVGPSSVAADTSGNLHYVDPRTRAVTKRVGTTLTVIATLPVLADTAGATMDSSNNLYLVDTYSRTVLKVTTAGAVSTFAGPFGVEPYGIAVDIGGNVYVADRGDHTIRKITPAGVVSVFVGSAGSSGTADGTGAAARFNGPGGVAVDASGTVYVSDTNNYSIRKVTALGVVTTIAGTVGVPGTSDGTGSAARFANTYGLVVDASGDVFIADCNNSTIRKMTPVGVVTTIAGLAQNRGSTDGTGSAARFDQPLCLALGAGSIIYVADHSNMLIRQVTYAGVTTTITGLAGSYTGEIIPAVSDSHNVALDASGIAYVISDSPWSTLRSVTRDGVVTTLTGQVVVPGFSSGVIPFGGGLVYSGVTGSFLGTIQASLAGWGSPVTMYSLVYSVNTAGTVVALAGGNSPGCVDGTGASAQFYSAKDICAMIGGDFAVTDITSIRRVTSGGVVTTITGTWDGSFTIVDGDLATARFANPSGIVMAPNGKLYVTDFTTVREITLDVPGIPGSVVTIAGDPAGSDAPRDGTGSGARFGLLGRIAADASGNLYVLDSGLVGTSYPPPQFLPYGVCLRKITPSGVVTTIAGELTDVWDYWIKDGVGPAADFGQMPRGLLMDPVDGALWMSGRDSVRRVAMDGTVTSVVWSTVGPAVDLGGGSFDASSGSYSGSVGDSQIPALPDRRGGAYLGHWSSVSRDPIPATPTNHDWTADGYPQYGTGQAHYWVNDPDGSTWKLWTEGVRRGKAQNLLWDNFFNYWNWAGVAYLDVPENSELIAIVMI